MINIVEQDSEQFEAPSVSYKIYRLGSLENQISDSSGKPEFIQSNGNHNHCRLGSMGNVNNQKTSSKSRNDGGFNIKISHNKTYRTGGKVSLTQQRFPLEKLNSISGANENLISNVGLRDQL